MSGPKETDPEDEHFDDFLAPGGKRVIAVSTETLFAMKQVVEAAHALISAMTGDKRYRDDLLEERCFQALEDAVDALEEEEE